MVWQKITRPADTLKPSPRAAAEALHAISLDVVMITGDHAGAAAAIAISGLRDVAQSNARWCGHGVQFGLGGGEFSARATVHRLIGAKVSRGGSRSAYMAEWAIETHDLTKRYGYRPVLSGVDLYVKPGEFVVLFGPNGAGKSTLIRILCTLMKPSGGTVNVAGYSITDDPDRVRARIGLIGHSSYLYEELSAVFAKLGVTDRLELVIYAYRYDLISHRGPISGSRVITQMD
jgi:ABC-type multidrug transport system fused ATPase/permease subunit